MNESPHIFHINQRVEKLEDARDAIDSRVRSLERNSVVLLTILIVQSLIFSLGIIGALVLAILAVQQQ